MPDTADTAQAAESLLRETAIHAARRRPTGDQVTDDLGVIVCRDCGEPLALARLLAVPTACRCVECQTAADEGFSE